MSVPTQRAPDSRVDVLVVDDDPEIRSILSERLGIEGFRVEMAASAEEALVRYVCRQVRGEPFDVLLVDIGLDLLDGTDLLRILRAVDPGTTILMISGLSSLDQAVESLREGADDFLRKPIKVWDIRDRLTTAMARRRTIAERTQGGGLEWGTVHPSTDLMVREGRPESDLSVAVGSEVEGRTASDSPPREMGNEEGPDDSVVEIPWHRTGESCAGGFPKGDQGRASGREKRGRVGTTGDSDFASTVADCLGGSVDFESTTPLDAFLELATIGDQLALGFPIGQRHGDLVVKVAAFVTGSWGLRPEDLAILQLSARSAGLGRLGVAQAPRLGLAARILEEFVERPGASIEGSRHREIVGAIELLRTIARMRDGLPARRNGDVQHNLLLAAIFEASLELEEQRAHVRGELHHEPENAVALALSALDPERAQLLKRAAAKLGGQRGASEAASDSAAGE